MTAGRDGTRALKALGVAAEERIAHLRWRIALLESELAAHDGAPPPPSRGMDAPAAAPPAAQFTGSGSSGLLVDLEHHRVMLAAMRASTSWRITRPLRALKRLLGGEREPEAVPARDADAASWPAPAAAPVEVAPMLSGADVTAQPGASGPDAGRRVAVLAPVSPQGAAGGAERLYAGLVAALRARGCTVELITVAVDERSFETIQDAYRTFERLDLAAFDCVISTKAPSYAVFHPNHVVYLVHTVRAFYDMFDETASDAQRRRQRAWIQRADTHAIGRARVRFAIGEEVAGRLAEANDLHAGVLHPGLILDGLHDAGLGDHFFLPGRLHAWKRVDLVIRAVRASRLPMKLAIAGDGEAEAALHKLADGDPRITFLGRVSDETLRQHYAACLAVPFVPLREDYGYVTIEAFASGKAVVTCSDSGEPARIVEDGVTGLVVAPEVDALRLALERLWQDRALAARLGAGAQARVRDFTWDGVAEALLATAFDAEPPLAAKAEPLRVAVLDMQPITPPLGGGRARLLGLYHDLGPGFETRYVGSFDDPASRRQSGRLSPTLTETVVPLSDAHHAAARAAATAAGGHTVIDALFGQHAHLSPEYLAAVDEAVAWADIVVFSHPWVAPLVGPERLAGKRIVYDAQNCEGRLKAALFDVGDPAQAAVVAYVVACEKALGERADLVIACSEPDRTAFVEDHGWPAERIAIVANGAFAGKTPTSGAAERHAARAALGIPDDLVVAIFLGSDYPPNVAAARFIKERLARELPSALFVIAGGCSERLGGGSANCRLAGTLGEAEKSRWLLAADIALNPVATGSGTNVKMFDYMAHGLPVVTTPTGARGIAEGTRAGLIVTDEGGFARDVGALAAGRPGHRAALGRANRAWAIRDFDWPTISRRLGHLLRETAAGDAEVTGLRIAHLSTTGLRCGIGEYNRHLIAALEAGGAANLLLTATNGDEVPNLATLPQPARVAWERDTVDWRYPAILPEAMTAITAWRPDRLIVQYHPSFHARGDIEHLVRSTLAAGVPTRLVIHAFEDEDAPLLRRLDALGCVLFSHSPTELKRAQARGLPFVRLPMPVSDPPPAASAAPGGPHLVANGFMRRHKGFRHLVDAMPAILRGHPAATLTLLAPRYPAPDSDIEAAACRERIESLGLEKRVTIDDVFRDRADLIARIARADLAILPYEHSDEGGSAAAADVLAAGTPLVVSHAAIFDDLRHCTAATEPEPAEIAYTVLKLLAEPQSLAGLRDAAARHRRSHSWQAAARRIVL